MLDLRGGGGSLFQSATKDKIKADLEAMDTDKSGTVTKDEYVAYYKHEYEVSKRVDRLSGIALTASTRQWERMEKNVRKRCDRRGSRS